MADEDGYLLDFPEGDVSGPEPLNVVVGLSETLSILEALVTRGGVAVSQGAIFLTDIPYHGPRAEFYDPLGVGMVRPFYRATHGDFISNQGVPVVMSNVGQILGTRKGTIPWRPEFGSLLESLRHLPNTGVLRELAKVYVQDALGRWEPRATATGLAVLAPQSKDELNQVRVRTSVAIAGATGNQKIELKISKERLPAVPDEVLAWAPSARVPRGMGALADQDVRPVRSPRQVFVTGLVRPFVRGGDLNHGSDEATLRSNVGQVLGTSKGTLPWRPEFGCVLHRLRHMQNSEVIRELGRADINQALRRWEPRAKVTAVDLVEGVNANTMAFRVHYRSSSLQAAQTRSIDVMSR